MSKQIERIEIKNVASPGSTTRVDKTKYEAMKAALLKVLPSAAPGLTVAEAKVLLLPVLSQQEFPSGEKAGWWLKAVQLDLEAKGILVRQNTKPLRLHRAAG